MSNGVDAAGRLASLESRLANIETRLAGLDTRMAGMDTRLVGFESMLQRILQATNNNPAGRLASTSPAPAAEVASVRDMMPPTLATSPHSPPYPPPYHASTTKPDPRWVA